MRPTSAVAALLALASLAAASITATTSTTVTAAAAGGGQQGPMGQAGSAAVVAAGRDARSSARLVLGRVHTLADHDAVGLPEIHTTADRVGTVTAAWTRPPAGIRVARRVAGHAWTAPQAVSRGCCDLADVQADASGTVTLAYLEANELKVRSQRPGAGWGKVYNLSVRSGLAPHGYPGHDGTLAVGPTGAAVATWLGNDLDHSAVAYKPAGRSWAHARYRVMKGTVEDVAVSANGSSVIITSPHWTSDTLYTRRFVPGHGWSPREPIGHGDGASVAMTSRGGAVATWTRPWGDPIRGSIIGRRMSPTGTWQRPRTVKRLGQLHQWVPASLAMDRRGNAVVAWERAGIHVARQVVGHAWTSHTVFRPEPHRLLTLQGLSVNPAGDAALLWNSQPRPRTAADLLVMLRPRGHRWTGPARLGRSAVFDQTYMDTPPYWVIMTPSAALTPAGEAVAVWFNPALAVLARTASAVTGP